MLDLFIIKIPLKFSEKNKFQKRIIINFLIILNKKKKLFKMKQIVYIQIMKTKLTPKTNQQIIININYQLKIKVNKLNKLNY